MAQTVDSATAELRRRANRVTARRDSAEKTTGSLQHALAEELLRAVPSARQRRLAVDCWEHVDWGAIRMPSPAPDSLFGDTRRRLEVRLSNHEGEIIMALYMLMAKYSPAAIKGIMETGSDREAAAREAVETAGGRLLGFYGMVGQEYNLAMIVETPGYAEYMGALAPAILGGVFDSYKTIPLFTHEDVKKAIPIAKKVRAVYRPPTG